MRHVFLLLALAAACRPSSDPSAPAPAITFSSADQWPERGTYPGVGQGRLLITNNRDDSISLFDLTQVGQASLPELARLPVGLNPVEIEAPHHAAITPDGAHWFTALSQFAPGTGTGPHGSHGTGAVDGQLLKLSTADNRVLAVTRVDRSPGDLVVSPDGKTVAVSHYDLLRISEAARGAAADPDARVLLFDTGTLERTGAVRVCAAPHGMQFSADGKRLYVSCYSDEVAVVRLDDPALPVTRVKVASNAGDAFSPVYQPYGLAVSPVNGDVFVSCLAKREVRVLSAATLTMDPSRTTLLGGAALLGDFDGATLYVPHQGDDRISVIDSATGTETRSIGLPGCLNVHQVEVVAPGQLAVVCEGDHASAGALLVIDGAAGTVVSTTQVGVFPDWVGVIRP